MALKRFLIGGKEGKLMLKNDLVSEARPHENEKENRGNKKSCKTPPRSEVQHKIYDHVMYCKKG
ncbi:CLUMA_CG000655, isoform A [Clunio marinus]|uniref:CLUMA_CG000655, isoform A n=1 Tax=Clunio marinus TaxID=568069 RepID=A0A1J1HGZ7_9DIPT|nr:CLUMA_CG000655, isoform A [Clunio marinus]